MIAGKSGPERDWVMQQFSLSHWLISEMHILLQGPLRDHQRKGKGALSLLGSKSRGFPLLLLA